MTSVPTKVGSPFGTPALGDSASTTSRATAVIPTVVTGDIIYCFGAGGANTWKHVLTAPGVTFTVEQYNNAQGGHLTSCIRGYVTNGASASGQVITCVLTDASDVTQSSKFMVCAQAWHGMDNGGTNGSNATHRLGAFVVGGGANSTVATPAVTASTIANCVVMLFGSNSRGSTVPQILAQTFAGGAADYESYSQGTASLHGGAIKSDLTAAISTGVVLGGVSVVADQTGSPRSTFTLLIAPFPDAVSFVTTFAALRAAGYTGSLSDMRRQNLLALLSLTEPQAKSNNDLEFQYLRSIGKTGSLNDMRRQP